MNAKWLLLLKIQFMGIFGLNRVKNSTDPKVKKKAAGAIAAIVAVGAIILFYVIAIAVSFCKQGIGLHLPALTVAISSFITFFFALFQGCNLLFAMKDYDLVLSLPIPKRQILLAKLLCSYLINLLFTIVIVLPVSVILFIFEGFSPSLAAIILAATLFAPLLPFIVAATLSVLITMLTAGMRLKTLFQSILSVAFFAGIMIAYFSFSFNTDAEAGPDMNAIYEILVGKIYLPAVLIEMTVSGKAVWGIFAFIGASVLPAALFIVIFSEFFSKINAALRSGGARIRYNAKNITASSPFKALIKKEFRRLITCPAYLLNGLSGTLLMLIAAVALLFVNPETLLQIPAEQFAALKTTFLYVGIGLMILFITMSCPSGSALSLEGTSRGLLFSLPVTARKILIAKAFPTFLINLIAAIFFGTVLCVRFDADWLGWVSTALSAVSFPVFIALLGSFLNYKFPKYDWTTETSVVKNSVPVLITVLGGMVLGTAVILLALLVSFYFILAIDILIIAASVLFSILFKNYKLYIA